MIQMNILICQTTQQQLSKPKINKNLIDALRYDKINGIGRLQGYK